MSAQASSALIRPFVAVGLYEMRADRVRRGGHREAAQRRSRPLVVTGGSIGFCFAALALCLSVISFPLMLDRDIGLVPAIAASLRLSRECPVAVALGLIVAAALVVASLPLFIGLAVAVPTLGHSTWRLYRRAVEREARLDPPVEQRRAGGGRRQNPRRSSEALRNAGDRKTHAASVIR